jgi:hypothetical protein
MEDRTSSRGEEETEGNKNEVRSIPLTHMEDEDS